MSRKPNPKKVGAFVLGGAVLIVLAVGTWGSGRLFRRHYRYVCYFSGSVNGLDIGSPVKYRGVPIGRVVDMRIHFEQSWEDTRIPVFIELAESRLKELGLSDGASSKLLSDLIQRGLRARLETVSFVTGQLFVNLDLFPETPAELVHRVPGTYKEIPTMPTTLEEASRSLTAFLRELKEINLGSAMKSMALAIEGINRLVNTPAIEATLAELPSTVASLRQLAKGVKPDIDQLSTSIKATLDDLRKSLDGARALIGMRGPVVPELQRTLIGVQKAADSIRVLAEFLQRNPNALIVGKKRP
jgi:paraquat-inducible protein B